MSDFITIKGGKDGLRLQLDAAAEWTAIVEHLQQQLTQNQSFFAGAQLVVDIGERELSEQQMSELLTLMQQHGIHPESLDATARASRNAARAAGIVARPIPRYQAEAAPQSMSDAMMVTRTMRSGQVLRHHGHITLIGDVNPGAEVIASGSVVVWGRLRGVVHAGALGDTDVLICALELRPTQLRIADQIARTPDGVAKYVPEIARLEQGQIVVEAWETHRK